MSAEKGSVRTESLVLAGPPKPRARGGDERVGSRRRDAEGIQHASLGFRLRRYDVVGRKQIDLIAGRGQQCGKKAECRFRPKLRAGRDPTRRSEGKADKQTSAINCA